MILYLDIMILFDIIVNFIFLYFITKLFSYKANILKITIFSFLAGILIIVAIYSKIFFIIYKVIGGIIICLFSIKSILIERKIIEISLFYALNFALVGFLNTFRITEWYLLVLAITLILVMFILENFRKYFIKISNLEYNVIIDNISLKAFMDTGNNAYYKEYPIVFVNIKYFNKKKMIKSIIIDVNTIAGNSQRLGFLENNFIVKVNNTKIVKKVIISYANIDYDCIIGTNLMI